MDIAVDADIDTDVNLHINMDVYDNGDVNILAVGVIPAIFNITVVVNVVIVVIVVVVIVSVAIAIVIVIVDGDTVSGTCAESTSKKIKAMQKQSKNLRKLLMEMHSDKPLWASPQDSAE